MTLLMPQEKEKHSRRESGAFTTKQRQEAGTRSLHPRRAQRHRDESRHSTGMRPMCRGANRLCVGRWHSSRIVAVSSDFARNWGFVAQAIWCRPRRCSLSQRCSTFAFIPCSHAVAAIDTPDCRHAAISSPLNCAVDPGVCEGRNSVMEKSLETWCAR